MKYRTFLLCECIFFVTELCRNSRTMNDSDYGTQTKTIGCSSGHVCLNIRDVIATEEDIFRYKPGNQKWYIPNTFRVPTASHDVEHEQQFAVAPESRSLNSRSLRNRLELVRSSKLTIVKMEIIKKIKIIRIAFGRRNIGH